MQNKTVEELAEENEKLQNEKLEWHSQVQCKLRLESQLANVLAVNEKLNVDLSGWKAKKGLQWVRASERLPEIPKYRKEYCCKWTDKPDHYYFTERFYSDGTFKVPKSMYKNLLWLDDESEPNPDEPKQTAIAFAEYTREAPGNMWQRAHGPLLSTEELYEEFVEYLKNKKCY